MYIHSGWEEFLSAWLVVVSLLLLKCCYELQRRGYW